MKFILHGGYTRRDNESNCAFYDEFVRDISDGGMALLVYFATRDESHILESFDDLSAKFKAHAGEKNINFILATKEDFIAQFKKADAVFINGGSTSKLLNVLRTYPDLKPLIGEKTIAGSSAGAYAIAHLGASHSEEVVREGLGLAPLRVVCHYESPELPPSDASVSLLKNTSQDLELVLLKDCEWKVFRY
ncbi:MAG: Type 1 glutamine amidotransferase-like domain-containing protein [Candidatus Kaiserbacteria bacterium]|nr:Type 1 glutamine amidotransferase-like domain-containing protein [Candidatus Kaiserbacteria bacterium]